MNLLTYAMGTIVKPNAWEWMRTSCVPWQFDYFASFWIFNQSQLACSSYTTSFAIGVNLSFVFQVKILELDYYFAWNKKYYLTL